MVEIARSSNKLKSTSLISLIDVIFQILIYFMISTSFVQTESLELALPKSAAQVANKSKEKTLHIYISDIGETFLEQKSMNEQEMMESLKKIFSDNADRGVLVLSASKVTVQVMVRVMDRIYTAGGKNIAVADWVIPAQPKLVTEQPNG
jgi:biopolymer transport protein ExbD